MNPKDCYSYEKCNATICPMDESTRDIAIWYPDEEICGSMLFRKEKWRIAQRKIAKRTRNTDSFFTLAMLNAVIAVGKGIKGASPDRSESRIKNSQLSFLKNRAGVALHSPTKSNPTPFSSLETAYCNVSPTDSIGNE